MRDDDTTPMLASSPNDSLDDDLSCDDTCDDGRVSELLSTLAAIPLAALPDHAACDLLARYCRAGAVDNLYRPFGSPHWIIAWATFPPERDPRQRLDDWLALVRDARLTRPASDAASDLIDDPLWRTLTRQG